MPHFCTLCVHYAYPYISLHYAYFFTCVFLYIHYACTEAVFLYKSIDKRYYLKKKEVLIDCKNT